MQLQFENQGEIPVGSEESFVEFEQEGKQVWVHKDLADAKKTAFRFQGQVSKLTNEFEGFKGKISKEQELLLQKAEQDKSEAIAEQMSKFKGENNHAELHKLEMQQQADKYNSQSQAYDQLKSQFEGLQTSLVEKENLNLATNIASQYVPSEMVDSFSKLLMMSHIKNVEGKSVFTNASGDAVDGDIERVLEVLNNDPNLKHFAKFPGSKGGHGAKGGQDHGNSKTISRRDFEGMHPFQQSKLIKSGVKVIE